MASKVVRSFCKSSSSTRYFYRPFTRYHDRLSWLSTIEGTSRLGKNRATFSSLGNGGNNNNDNNDSSNDDAKMPANQFVSQLKGPIVNQLWTARQEAKDAVLAMNPDGNIDMERPRSPSESNTKICYPFETDVLLKEEYRNPFGQVRFGKLLEDLDALAGNIAFAHVQDPKLTIVTASVDRIRLSAPPNLESNQELSGKVTYVGKSSMEIRMQCRETGEDDPWLESYFTFVATDPTTKRPLPIPPLDPQSWLERDQFEAGQRRATLRKEARKKRKNFESPLDSSDVEKEAVRLLQEAGPLMNIPSLANPDCILVPMTKLQNVEIAQPQARNLANQIFGGFLMRRAFELAYATCYVFGGARPRFLEVDQVNFSLPVNVGDLTNFQARVIHTEVKDEIRDFNVFRGQRMVPIVSIEVAAWIVEPEQASAKLSNQFYFTFALPSGSPSRRVLPSNMEEARRMAIRIAASKE